MCVGGGHENELIDVTVSLASATLSAPLSAPLSASASASLRFAHARAGVCPIAQKVKDSLVGNE